MTPGSSTDVLLALETSCDETAAAVTTFEGAILSSIVYSQIETHAPYGGVVPELAARRHVECIDHVARKALHDAGRTWHDVRAVAATQGPGLAGALLVGLNYGKACAYGLKVPLLLVNHLEGHMASAWMGRPEFPREAVVLVVSGGHTHLYHAQKGAHYRLLGRTQDDAAGEAYDKAAKLLGLGYPGGPLVDRLAKQGNPRAIRFPRSMGKRGSLDFSFSGLKTSLLYYLRDHADWREPGRLADIAASFQEAIVDVLVAKTLGAARRTGVQAIAVVGGVSANSRLRTRLGEECAGRDLRLSLPPMSLCTDNAAMIAAAGLEAYRTERTAGWDAESAADLSLRVDAPIGPNRADGRHGPPAA